MSGTAGGSGAACSTGEQQSVDSLIGRAYTGDHLLMSPSPGRTSASVPSTRTRIAAGLLATLFAVVMLLAGACALAHTLTESHHHGDTAATPLSSACGWSCQAVSSGLGLAAVSLVWTWAASSLLHHCPRLYVPDAGTVFLPSRAPPIAA